MHVRESENQFEVSNGSARHRFVLSGAASPAHGGPKVSTVFSVLLLLPSLILSRDPRRSDEAEYFALLILEAVYSNNSDDLSRALTVSLSSSPVKIQQTEQYLRNIWPGIKLADVATEVAIARISDSAGQGRALQKDKLITLLQPEIMRVADAAVDQAKEAMASIESNRTVDINLDRMEEAVAALGRGKAIIEGLSKSKSKTKKSRNKQPDQKDESPQEWVSRYADGEAEVVSDVAGRIHEIISKGKDLMAAADGPWSDRAMTMVRVDRALRLHRMIEKVYSRIPAEKRRDVAPRDLAANVTDASRKTQPEVSDLALQAHHLDQFMYWWLRGRYGRSSLANGLVRPYPAQAVDLERQFLSQAL